MRGDIIAQWKAWFLTQIRGLRRSQAKTLLDLVIGLIRAERLGVASIGRGMSGPAAPKHRIKRVDRFLGNPRLNREAAAQDAIRFIVMGRRWVHVVESHASWHPISHASCRSNRQR
ncbi:hypothetical protein TPY_2322 [Sulfobacillus acidophilus TPY]|nr:hypothetical protein TPY_2322 [Sulfobacillus acidophilus TPY]